jgi:hypothetical protein
LREIVVRFDVAMVANLTGTPDLAIALIRPLDSQGLRIQMENDKGRYHLQTVVKVAEVAQKRAVEVLEDQRLEIRSRKLSEVQKINSA